MDCGAGMRQPGSPGAGVAQDGAPAARAHTLRPLEQSSSRSPHRCAMQRRKMMRPWSRKETNSEREARRPRTFHVVGDKGLKINTTGGQTHPAEKPQSPSRVASRIFLFDLLATTTGGQDQQRRSRRHALRLRSSNRPTADPPIAVLFTNQNRVRKKGYTAQRSKRLVCHIDIGAKDSGLCERLFHVLVTAASSEGSNRKIDWN